MDDIVECPYCGSVNIKYCDSDMWVCEDCGHTGSMYDLDSDYAFVNPLLWDNEF